MVGTARPGSPILYPDADYNMSAAMINREFPGSEELFVVVETPQQGNIKDPRVLRYLEKFQQYMLDDPEVGGTKSIVDLVKLVNQINHHDDPKWAQIPHDAAFVGGVLFSYMASAPIPGSLDEYIDAHERRANVVFYYKDHRGPTIARAIERVNAFLTAFPPDGVTLRLAGGLMGVTAAMNEEIIASNLTITTLVFVAVFCLMTAGYRSLVAAVLVSAPLALATISGEAFLALMGVGLNVNTAPVVAVGIGVGVDYAIYLMDRIKQEYGPIRGPPSGGPGGDLHRRDGGHLHGQYSGGRHHLLGVSFESPLSGRDEPVIIGSYGGKYDRRDAPLTGADRPGSTRVYRPGRRSKRKREGPRQYYTSTRSRRDRLAAARSGE